MSNNNTDHIKKRFLAHRNNPIVRMYLDIIENLPPESREKILEEQVKVASVSDEFETGLQQILRSETGFEKLQEEIRKRIGK